MLQRNSIALAAITAVLLCCGQAPGKAPKPAQTPEKDADGWVSIFDGKSFDGWKVSTENPKTFTIKDGAIVAKGPRAHLFYAGKVADHNFKNFELKIDVMTKPGSNGGVYFHTKYQTSGWPGKGFEVQVNNTHKDPKKSGGLYGVQDVFKAPAKDGEWFTEHIIVRGKQITVKVDGKTLVEFTEPTPAKPPRGMGGRFLSSGTFALQGHDPKSTVFYKNIRVKVLDGKKEGFTPLFDGKTLKGWKGRQSLWKVEGGAICGQTSTDFKLKHNDFLYTEKEYENFELTLSYKLGNGNSGVQIRSIVHDDFRITGYQADIAEKRYTGILYDEGRRGIIADVKPAEVSKFIKKGWNDYRIVCKGNEITLWINGQQTISYTEKKASIPSKGVIAFQLHRGPPMTVYFKDIRIKELPADGGN